MENPDQAVDEAWSDRKGVLVTRKEGRPFVVISPEEYEALDATAFLTRNPENAERLRQSIEQAETGKVVYKTIEELEEMAG